MDSAPGPSSLRSRAEDLYRRYCVAVDACDLDDLAAMVLPDVHLTRVDGTRVGVDAFLDLYRDFHADLARQPGSFSQHVVHHVRAWPVEDGRVETRAYFQATFVRGDEAQLALGSYADVHVDSEDRHLIAHKVIDVQRVVTLGTVVGG